MVYFPFIFDYTTIFLIVDIFLERYVGLEPTLFHFGRVMPYQLGEYRIWFRSTGVEPAIYWLWANNGVSVPPARYIDKHKTLFLVLSQLS